MCDTFRVQSTAKRSVPWILSLALASSLVSTVVSAVASAAPTTGEILAATTAADWRPLNLDDTVYLELATGRVVIELAPTFAPLHVANIKTLVKSGYFNGLAVVRVQDNYVVQWADPDGARAVPAGVGLVAAEFDVSSAAVPDFTPIGDGDVYAPVVGFSNGFPAARDPKRRRTWLAHCYGMVGVGRDEAPESSGTELYAVIGHAPRHLDRNVALVGRVVSGIEHLSSLPRGSAAMGFYAKGEVPVPIRAMELASEVAPAERTNLEILRTDTPRFAALVESRRNRPESWFVSKAGHIDLCNIPIPVRPVPPAPAAESR
jgi:peptidylprolyl isomerase